MKRVKADFCIGVAVISAFIGVLFIQANVIAYGSFMSIATIFLGIAIQLTIEDED